MTEPAAKEICGVVMPISAIDGCAESHWADVLEILTEAIEDAGFEANLVSNADDVGIIHKRIIQNLYDNPIIVCDVSGKNQNVMFELGLRLAFDKPTVIVKDEKTAYAFDTSAIEHLEYPRDLRFSRIVEFKQKLAEKIAATYKKATTDSSYTTFLKHFGEFKVAKLDKKEVSGQEYILDELRSIRQGMRRLELTRVAGPRRGIIRASGDVDLCVKGWSEARIDETAAIAAELPGVLSVRIRNRGPDHRHMIVSTKPGTNVAEIESLLSPRATHKLTRSRPPSTGVT
jgi:hypothetical protein